MLSYISNYNLYSISQTYFKQYRRVALRMKRTIICDRSNLNIYSQGSEKYLRMPYLRPHSAQLDIEARADDNELVLVGLVNVDDSYYK